MNQNDVNAELAEIAHKAYSLAEQYFAGLRGRHIEEWENELASILDEYELVRERASE